MLRVFSIFSAMSKYYAGIGARKTPQWALNIMSSLGKRLENDGYCLRSGGAEGADTSFAMNVSIKEIYRPEDATIASLAHASEYHPNWYELNTYVQKLHARNSQILLGMNLDKPVDFVVCWTKNGMAVGGTGQAIRVSLDKNIPVFNLADHETLQRMKNYLGIVKTESLL
jgi:hypothetical protein